MVFRWSFGESSVAAKEKLRCKFEKLANNFWLGVSRVMGGEKKGNLRNKLNNSVRWFLEFISIFYFLGVSTMKLALSFNSRKINFPRSLVPFSFLQQGY